MANVLLQGKRDPRHPAVAASLTPETPDHRPGRNAAADAKLDAGDAAMNRDDFVAAQQAYQQADALAPNDPAPLVGRALALLAANDFSVAVNAATFDATARMAAALFKSAQRRDQDYGPAFVELGRLFLVTGKTEEACAMLQRGVMLLPRDPEAVSSLGVCHLASGKIAPAVKALSRAAALDPSQPGRHDNLGTALLQASRPADAIASYRQAIKLAPKTASYHNNLATALLQIGDVSSAMPHLKEAISLDPLHPNFLSNLGYAYLQRSNDQKAITVLKQALTIDPKLISAWVNLGNAFAQQGNLGAAENAFRSAAKLDAKDPRVVAALDELANLKKQRHPKKLQKTRDNQ